MKSPNKLVSVLSFIIAIVGVLYDFPIFRVESWGEWVTVIPEWLVKPVLIFFLTLLYYLIYIVFSYFARKKFRSSIKVDTTVVLAEDASGERIEDFRKLRHRAKESIIVMGIGMTNFSKDHSLLEKLLKKGVHVKLLIMNPDVIKKHECEHICGFKFCDKDFDIYHDIEGYTSDVQTSYNRIIDFIQNKFKAYADKIELRKYSYYFPMNFTIIDVDNKKGKMIYENLLPFSQNRIRINISRKDSKELYDTIILSYQKMWDKSEEVKI